ncbi:MAG: hypothetical protein FWG80_01990 [Alphaproteobacteria bacterium]|nr:hypothetical protein [Alphaproteobacteria bacterium]
MKQVEITVKVIGNLDDVIKCLADQGFYISKKSRVEDQYLSNQIDSLANDNIIHTLSGSVMLRYLDTGDRIWTGITHKNKTYGANGDVLSEEKINIDCNDLVSAKKLFNALGFQTLVNVNYDVIRMQNDKIQFAFQNVEKLGLLLECESEKDATGWTEQEINTEKKSLVDAIRALGISISEDSDIKKAYELIKIQKID